MRGLYPQRVALRTYQIWRVYGAQIWQICDGRFPRLLSVQTIVFAAYRCFMDKDTVARQFGLIVRRHRTAMNMSQETLAAEAACHPTYVSLLERGKRNPSLDTMLRIADALNVKASDLVRETEAKL